MELMKNDLWNGKKLTRAATLAGLAALTGAFLFPPVRPKEQTKPQFTEDELKQLRVLPKKDRKEFVNKLKDKYFAKPGV